MQNEFEKQMQHKMDELQIHPSEAVWQKVQAQITKPKRRRGVIVLFFFLAGFVLGGYWLFQQNQPKPYPSGNANSIQNDKLLTIAGNKKENTDAPVLHREASADLPDGIKKSKASSRFQYRSSFVKPFKESNDNNESSEIVTGPKKEDNYIDELHTLPEKNNDDELDTLTNTQDSLPSQLIQPKIMQQSDTVEKTFVNTIPLKKISEWKFGVLFSLGRSGVVDNFLSFDELLSFNEDKSAAALDYASSPGTGGTNQGSNNNSVNPSKIQRSGAFIVGLSAEKRIAKKINLSVGINYKYFSTTNRVGQKNDTSGAFRVNNSGHKYHNAFNYLEIPAELKLQLWANKKMPVYLSGGISISRLISSNSLQYDLTARGYFNDNSFFNKTQIGFSTGLFAELFSKQKSPLLIGPDFYFAATNLARGGSYNKKHFSYIGLRSQIMFRRK
jgi:hypothetical protein